MADIVKIVLPSDEGTKTPIATSSTDAGSASSSSSSGSSSDGALTAQMAVGAAKKIVAATGFKQIADSVISYDISKISLRTGATEYQQKVQFAYNEGMNAASSIGAIGMGALIGGPAGAAVAAAGVGISYIMKIIGWAQNANTIQIQENQEDISIQMQMIRAGSMGRRNG